MKFVATGAVVLAVLAVVGVFWLANARLMPPPQKIEQAIPDERIPH